MSLPLCVITDPDGQTAPDGSRYYCGFYIREILAHAGIPYDEVERPLSALDGYRVVLLPWHMPLAKSERTLLAEFVKSGGALIGLGGMSGLDDVFGAEDRGEMADGYVQVAAKNHPVTSGFNSSLHCFGGRRIKAADGTALARVMGASDGAVWSIAPGMAWGNRRGPGRGPDRRADPAGPSDSPRDRSHPDRRDPGPGAGPGPRPVASARRRGKPGLPGAYS